MISVLILLVLLSTDSSAIEIPQAWAEYIKGLLNMYEKASEEFYFPNEIVPPTKMANVECMPNSDDYLLPTVLIWDPVEQFSLQCPVCSVALINHRKKWTDGSNTNKPRILHSFKYIVLLVSRIYICENHHVLLAHDDKILKLLPRSLQVPFILLHKTGYTQSFVEQLLFLSNNGMNFYNIESIISQIRWDHHSQIENKFWMDVKDYKLHHPEENIENCDFPSFKFKDEPLNPLPSNDGIMKCFLRDFYEKEAYYVAEMASVTNTMWISCDHTFKIASNIGYLREDGKWIQQYDSAFFVLDDAGRVLAWQFTNGTSFDTVHALLSNLMTRFKSKGCHIEKVFIDNCCHWRKKLQSIFGNNTQVCLDLFHAVQRVSRVLSKKHPMYNHCINELRQVFRVPGDIGNKRSQPTPTADLLIKNADTFVEKWKEIKFEGVPILNNAAINEVSKLKHHMLKGCLSNIDVSCGTNRNEVLHKHLNSFFHRSRISITLAYAILMVLLYSHNCTIQNKPKKIVMPVSACIAKYQKELCKTGFNELPKDHFGVVNFTIPESTEVVYNKTVTDNTEDTTFDDDILTSILLKAVQDTRVYNLIKFISNYEKPELYSMLSKQVENLFSKKIFSPLQERHLETYLKCNNLKRVPVSGNGNCCFLSVAVGLQYLISKQDSSNPFLAHLASLRLIIDNTVEAISLQLRQLTINEWLSNRQHYENFLTEENIEEAAIKFSEMSYFQGELGDTMILAMSNLLHIPINIISNIPNHMTIPVVPRSTMYDEIIFVLYNHTGSGHYDAILPVSETKKIKYESKISCRCGINRNGPSCIDSDIYHTRCKCYKAHISCSSACKCKNCANSFGKRTVLGKRKRELHAHQKISIPSNKEFMQESGITLAHGPWTLLENSIFTHVIDVFQEYSKELIVDDLRSTFNEVVDLSKSPHSIVNIPDNITEPTYKTEKQVQGKLNHYLKVVSISKEISNSAAVH